MAQTLHQYVQATQSHQQHHVQTFQVPNGNDKMLEVNFGLPSSTGEQLTHVWIKTSSMVAYRGEVSFAREGVLEQGIGNLLKKSWSEEGATLTKATSKGHAQLYLADFGKIVTIFKLQGDSLVVNGNDLLAFEPNVTHKITMMKSVSSIVAGGLYNVKLSGHGYVAIMTHGKPIPFTIGQGMPPVFTDPQATVAWSGELSPEFKTDIQFKTLIGRSSGESFQMKFDGNRGHSGVVLVQPFEEKVSS